MFTSIDKAIVAAVMGLLFILQTSGINIPIWFSEDWVTTVIGVLTPILIWFIPNKEVKNVNQL